MNYQISIEETHKKGLSIAIRDENQLLVEKDNARFSLLKEKLSDKLNSEKDYMLFDRLRKEQIEMVKETIKKANSGVIEV